MKTRRVLLVLPSLVTHQLLSNVLSTIFVNFQNPSATLFSTPISHTFAAGCRSSLVVDIGCSEMFNTAIYEYREIHQTRTTRAMKKVTWEMVKMLRAHRRSTETQAENEYEDDDTAEADFDIAEDIMMRMACCPPTRGESQRLKTHQH